MASEVFPLAVGPSMTMSCLMTFWFKNSLLVDEFDCLF
jgi:hypothetical protein